MKKALIVVVVILGLGLAASIYYCFTIIQDKNALTAELQTTQNTLASIQGQLAHTSQVLTDTQKTLASTEEDLGSTRDELAATQGELETTGSKLASTESQLDTTRQTLNSKIAELDSANDKLKVLPALEKNLADTEKQLAIAEETLDGLGITVSMSYECSDVELIDNPEAENPTFKELKSFLSQDETERQTYIANKYDCSEFSRDLHNNAEAAGIRAAEVQIFFEKEQSGHALNAFLTSDYGLVYVDCTQSPDKIAYIKAGKVFKAIQAEWMISGSNVRNDSWWGSLASYYYLPSHTGGYMVTSTIRIYW